MSRRGILLAGGTGSRLGPLTAAVSKQLLPIYNKPMIYYPLSVLMLAGMREILVVTTPQDATAFRRLLGSGRQWGLEFHYAVQHKPEGIAQAIVIGAEFLAGSGCLLVLGDNIVYGHGLPAVLARSSADRSGATVLSARVQMPERYGVVTFDGDGRPVSIDEKPQRPASDWAVIGVYFYDGGVVDRAAGLKPSRRGEYEITDLNNAYLAEGKLNVERLGRGAAWFDAGTCDSLLDASEFVGVIERRQRQLIASPEEIAFNAGWIDRAELSRQAAVLAGSDYGRMLASLAERAEPAW